MNKYIIGILCLLGMISCDNFDLTGTTTNGALYNKLLCPKDKLKLGDICAIEHTDGVGNDAKNVYYIKKTCGKNKICSLIGSNIYQCQSKKQFKKLKVDKSCTINEECITGKCDSSKCKEITDCTYDYECEEGKFCSKKDSGTGKCEKFAEEDEECFPKTTEIAEKNCAPGLFCAYEKVDSTKGKCAKFGSKGVGKYCLSDNQCETGQCKGNYCIELTFVGDCKDDNSCEIKAKGIGGNEAEGNDSGTCSTYDKKKYCSYSLEKQKYFKDKIAPRFKNLSFKSLKKDRYDLNNEYYYRDTKYSQYQQVYNNWEQLITVGYIDKDGKVVNDNQCEYKFWWSGNSSSFTKLCLTLLTSLIVLLF